MSEEAAGWLLVIVYFVASVIYAVIVECWYLKPFKERKERRQ